MNVSEKGFYTLTLNLKVKRKLYLLREDKNRMN